MILRAAALLTALSLAACGGGNSSGNAQSSVDATTRAVYNDDFNGVIAHFDDSLKPQVTRSQVGTISDRMHALGAYQGLSYVGSDPTKNEYTYRAKFSNGAADVVVRLDPGGSFGAYRVFFGKDAAAQ